MKRLLVYIAVCVLTLISGCMVPQPEETPTPPASVTMTPSATATAVPTETNTPLPSVTPTPDLVISECIEVQSTLPEGHSFKGTLLLENPEFSRSENLSLYDLQTGKRFVFPLDYLYPHAISPDQTRLAINGLDLSTIDIISSNGSFIKRISTSDFDSTGRIAEWLDNDRIAVMNSGNWVKDKYEIAADRIVVININTDEMQLVPSIHPGLDMGNQPLYLGYWGTVVFDPQLSYVVYPGAVMAPESDGVYFMGYILYSLVEESVIAGVPGFRLYAMPDWFADGNHFIVAGFDDFYRVSVSGEIEKITQLNSEYIANKSYLLDDFYRLSPDEKLLAFWVAKYDENLDENQLIYTLAILNLEMGEIIDTCIPSSHYFVDSLFERSFPIWSSDSKSLVVSASLGEESGRDLVLVDLEKMAAYQLPSDWIPVGWLLAEDE